MKEAYKHKKILIICILFIAILLIMGTLLGLKFINHEKNQNKKILDLNFKIELLQNQLENKNIQYSDASYNYLAIGNSITKHGITDFWWNEIGMAASKKENDYFHIVSKYLEENGNLTSYAFNFSIWEIQSHDRFQTLELLEYYLNPKINLITIQLSENASNIDTLKIDYQELINYITEKCPNTKILIVDDFWSNEKSLIKQEISKENNIDFIDLSEIRNNTNYQSKLGSIVYDEEGNEHVICHDGVAKHPNDNGMEYIANSIISKLK